jgi:hypothetical protein
MKRLLGTDFGWRMIDALSTLTILITIGATLAIFVQAYGADTRQMQIMTAEVVDDAPPTRFASRDAGPPRVSILTSLARICTGFSR